MRTGLSDSTLVIDLVGDPAHGRLAESRFVERPFLPGGEHNLYELAFAATALGHAVELRGWLDRPAFDAFATALGCAPQVELDARPPTGDDVVVVPEGWADAVDYARLLLSPARLAMFVLAPPGLFGWPFDDSGWSRPDPLTVALDAVATPAQFRAIDALGITLLTHSPGLVAAAEAAGVSCALIGTGRPYPPPAFPDDRERPTDAVGLLANRWKPLVTAAAEELRGLNLDLIPETSNTEILRRLARARVLLWPSRIEGHATIPWEARSVGCVPVALASNRFAVGLSEADGAVVVDEPAQLPAAVRALLADHDRWSELSARARRRAREEANWERYLTRVGAALGALPPSDAGRGARAGLGRALLERDQAAAAAAHGRLVELEVELERVVASRDQLLPLMTELELVRADRERIDAERHRLGVELGGARERLAKLERYTGVSLARRAKERLPSPRDH